MVYFRIIHDFPAVYKKNFFSQGDRYAIMGKGDAMERSQIDKIAKTPEDKLLLAKLWDKINAGIRKNITTNTCFLSPRELELADYLFGAAPGLYRFGGYPEAERKMLVYLPDSPFNWSFRSSRYILLPFHWHGITKYQF